MLLLIGMYLSPTTSAQDAGHKTVIDKKQQDLARRLVRKAGDDRDEDIMAELIRMMAESTKKLSIDFDAGPDTQAIQQSIAQRLDDAIKLAAARTSRNQSKSNQRSDKRRNSSRQAKQTKPTQGSKGTKHKPTKAEPSSGDSPADSDTNQTPDIFLDARRNWGDLPQREREEIIQGASEGYLRRYKTWIEHYYRALQEAQY